MNPTCLKAYDERVLKGQIQAVSVTLTDAFLILYLL